VLNDYKKATKSVISENKIRQIIELNSEENDSGVALFCFKAFINHKHEPNVYAKTIGNVTTVFAKRDIEAGEEILIEKSAKQLK